MKRINNKDEGYNFIVLVAFLFLLFSTCYAEAADYNATYTPGPIDPIATGQTKNVSVTVKNTGTQSWTPGVTFLSYHWYQGGAYPVWDGERTSLPNSVAPNGTITLNAKVLANVPAGSYTLKWDMLGPATWFSQKSPPVPTGNQSVEVKTPLVEVVQIVYVSALVKALFTPNITGIFTSPVSLLRPEEWAVITGSSFGSNLGTVTITLPSGKKTYLVVREWYNTLIWVEVPPFTGEKDGTASIQVETAGKIASNKVNVDFEATRDIVQLPKNLVQANCADFGGCDDVCMDEDTTFSAFHHTRCCVSGDSGTDTFKITTPLKNGWVFKNYTFDTWYKYHGKAGVTNYTGEGSPTMEISVNWSTSGPFANDQWERLVDYWGDVYIIGPKGVPYQ